MSTEIEKYLKNNRPSLNVESPDDEKIWAAIARRRAGSDTTRKGGNVIRMQFARVRNIAALVVITLSLAYIANDLYQDRAKGRSLTLNQLDSELGQREREYMNLVSYKENEVSSFDLPDNEIIREIISELELQDKIYKEAMNDLREMGNDDQVINTIFDTYERKINMLELLIIETNKIRNYEERDQNSM